MYDVDRMGKRELSQKIFEKYEYDEQGQLSLKTVGIYEQEK
ncbi:MAG: hypothetical protein AAFO15_00150 [Pseudomonadota bacterium]